MFLRLGITLILKTPIPNSKSPVGHSITNWLFSLLVLYYGVRSLTSFFKTTSSKLWPLTRFSSTGQWPKLKDVIKEISHRLTMYKEKAVNGHHNGIILSFW